MYSSLDIKHAQYVLGLLPATAVQEFAFEALAFGYDGVLLRAMAALHSPTKWEVDRIFFPALREMGFEEYSGAEACTVLIEDTVARITQGELDPILGAEHIREYWKRSGYLSELAPLGGPFEMLLCTGRRDDGLRGEILDIIQAQQN